MKNEHHDFCFVNIFNYDPKHKAQLSCAGGAGHTADDPFPTAFSCTELPSCMLKCVLNLATIMHTLNFLSLGIFMFTILYFKGTEIIKSRSWQQFTGR